MKTGLQLIQEDLTQMNDEAHDADMREHYLKQLACDCGDEPFDPYDYDDFLRHPSRMTILSHGSQPALDAPKAVWDAAMQFFAKGERGYLANMAAHGYTVIEEEEGIVSVVCHLPLEPERNSGELLYRYGPEIFQRYILEGETLETRIAHVRAAADAAARADLIAAISQS